MKSKLFHRNVEFQNNIIKVLDDVLCGKATFVAVAADKSRSNVADKCKIHVLIIFNQHDDIVRITVINRKKNLKKLKVLL